MVWLTIGVILCVTAHAAQGATDAFEWCYHSPTCNDATWPAKAPQFCNGSRQSPIDIVPANATVDKNLTAFTLTNFNKKSMLNKIENTGKTVKVTLNSGVTVSGGNLPGTYESLQFHLHWGNGSSVPGSEHTVDGTRYAMELHIVNIKSSHNGNTTTAVADSTGFAALGFLINVMDTNETGQPASWKTLTNYLQNITEKGQSANITDEISLQDLVPGINFNRYYRYLGSLTTPLCYEAVVWTLFKEPVNVSRDLIDLFANTVRIGDNTTDFITNAFRNIQPMQAVTQSSGSKISSSFGLLILIVAMLMR